MKNKQSLPESVHTQLSDRYAWTGWIVGVLLPASLSYFLDVIPATPGWRMVFVLGLAVPGLIGVMVSGYLFDSKYRLNK